MSRYTGHRYIIWPVTITAQTDSQPIVGFLSRPSKKQGKQSSIPCFPHCSLVHTSCPTTFSEENRYNDIDQNPKHAAALDVPSIYWKPIFSFSFGSRDFVVSSITTGDKIKLRNQQLPQSPQSRISCFSQHATAHSSKTPWQ